MAPTKRSVQHSQHNREMREKHRMRTLWMEMYLREHSVDPTKLYPPVCPAARSPMPAQTEAERRRASNRLSARESRVRKVLYLARLVAAVEVTKNSIDKSQLLKLIKIVCQPLLTSK